MNKHLAVTVFILSVAAKSLFAQCTGVQTTTVTPTPGANCAPGTVYTICYTMNGYNQLGANWVDGFEVILNGPWAPGSLVGTTAPANCNGGNGAWIWANSVTGTASGQTHGPGYYFDLNPDGNPGNDYGDNGSACTWTMCFQVTVGNSPGSSISVGVEALSDGEVGSWNSSSCNGTTLPVFSCIIDNPCGTINAVVDQHESCAGNADGQATVTMTGGQPPITYSWNSIPLQTAQTAVGLTAGNYTATAIDGNGCTLSQTVTIDAGGSSDATINNINGTNTLCENDASIQLTTVQSGGSFSGPGVNASGLFDPANANVGNNIITYSIGGACPDSQTLNITVLPNADATITDPIPNYPGNIFCLNDPPEQLTAATAGGSWTGNGVSLTGLFNPSTAGAGNHAITYQVPNPCGDSDVIVIAVNAASNATINNANPTNTLCENDGSVQLTTIQGGGTFSGSGVSPTGLFDPGSANLGINTITYSIGGNCPDSQTMDINVNPNVDATITDPIPDYPGNLFCITDAPEQLTAVDAGGTWSGPGVAPTGLFDPASAGIGLHIINYDIPNPCGDNDAINITVEAIADATMINANPTNEFCSTDNAIQLTTVQAGGTFSGSGVSATGLFNPASATIGVNTISYTVGTNCPDSQTMDITVYQQADATIDPVYSTNQLCVENAPVQMTAATSGGIWSGNGVSPTGLFNPATAGIGVHTITYTIADPCGDIQTNDITVSAVTLDFATTPSICSSENGTATGNVLTGNAPYSYSWNTSPPQFVPTAIGLAAGNYDLTVQDDVGCTATATATVSFDQSDLSASIAGFTNTLCNSSCDGTITATGIDGTAPYQYLWDDPVNQTTALATGLCAGTYNVGITDSNGCLATAQMSISEPSALSAGAVMDSQSNCGQADGEATASALGGTVAGGYQYNWNSTPPQNTSTAIGLLPGTYTVTVMDDNNCTTTADVDITSTPGFTANINSFYDVSCFEGCNGDATITVGSGTVSPLAYSWNSVPAQTAATAVGLCAGQYIGIVTDAVGCTASDTIMISEPIEVVTQLTASAAQICIGESANLTSVASGGTGPYASYTWVAVPADQTLVATQQNPIVFPVVTTTYTLVAEDSNGCFSQPESITISVLPPLSLSVIRPAFNADTAICPYDYAVLDLQAAGGDGNYSYFLMPDDLNPVTFPMQTQPNGTTTYNFMVTDGCTTPPDFASSTITVHSLPDVIFSGDSLDGCHAHSTVFTDQTSPTPIAWNWNFGDPSSGSNTSPLISPTHQFSSAGIYDISLSVTTLEGCFSDTIFPSYVEVYPLPYANFTADPERTNLLQSNINFTDESVGTIAEWLWFFGDGDEAVEQHVEHAYLDTGAYLVTLTVTTDHGCEDWTRQQVIIDPDFMFYVPNTFTPNNDGKNDMFRGYGLGVKWDTYQLFVYNRWGEEIFYTNDIDHSWDGNFKGKAVPDEVYVWKIVLYDQLGESHTYRGRVTLLR